jgi:phospholipid/cholesterol/gamma-HCH transport system substrate-binding protein
MAGSKHHNPVFRPLIKFTIYAIICLILLFVLAARVGNLTPPTLRRDHYTAMLSDADSLAPKDDVKIAGVTVGQVHKITVVRGMAKVSFTVDHDIRLRQGTGVGLRWQDIIGDKYLYLYPSTTGPFMARGATLTDEVESADVGDFLMDVGGFLRALNPNDINTFTAAIVNSLQDNEAAVGSLLDNGATVAQTLGNQDQNIAQIVDNLNGILSSLESRDSDLTQVIDHLSSVASDLAARNDVIDDVIANFTQVNGELSQLVDQDGTNVDQITDSLQTIANVLQSHTAQLDQGLTTASAGLAPYIRISKLGQWFAIRVVYTCLENQTTCTYDQPANSPASLDNTPLNPVPGSAAGNSPGGAVLGTASANATRAAPEDPGALPIGPAVPQANVGNVIGFALYGDGSQS